MIVTLINNNKHRTRIQCSTKNVTKGDMCSVLRNGGTRHAGKVHANKTTVVLCCAELGAPRTQPSSVQLHSVLRSAQRLVEHKVN